MTAESVTERVFASPLAHPILLLLKTDWGPAKMIDFEQSVWFYSSALAAAVPVMIPALQFGFIYKIWDKYNKKVDRHNCRNTCWDTVFKGGWILTSNTDWIQNNVELPNQRVRIA